MPISEEIKNIIQGSYNELETAGFRKRKPQMLLMGKLATAASEGRVFVGEGPTGVGKSVSYTLGLIPIAQKLDNPLILSTATIALQNQLVDDLTMLQKNTSLKFTFAKAKGRSNYYCPAAADQSFGGGLNSAYEEKKLREMSDDFNGKWDGDFDKLKGKTDFKIQKLCTSSTETCNRRTCDYSTECPYYKNIDAVRDADVVISNHALTTAMSEMGFGVYLRGDDSECTPLLVIDECHHIHEIFRQAMSLSLNFEDSSKKLKSNSRFDKELSGYNKVAPYAKEAQSLANEINKTLKELSDATHAIIGEQPLMSFKEDLLNEHYTFLLSSLKDLATSYKKQVTKIDKFIKDEKDSLPKKLVESITIKSKVSTNICSNIIDTSTLLFKETPKATWFEYNKNKTYCVNACPLDIKELFNEKIINECHSVTMVSATIRTNGDFSYINNRLGLPDDSEFLKVPSPFDASKATLHTPNIGYLPNDPKHIIAVSQQAPALFKLGEGSMVLFSSWTKLNAFKDNLPNEIKAICLVQGEHSRSEITSKHKKAVDAGKTSVVLGLQTFGEGTNFKGAYLTTLIIPQIPFMHVQDPVSAAENTHYESLGMNAFMKVSLPEATTKIIQWCGRLIRSEEDTGNIYIFDNRITTKGYGKGIIDTLPAYNRI